MPTEVSISVPDELFSLIKQQADRQYRPVEGQILWLLECQLGLTGPSALPQATAVRIFRDAMRVLHVEAGEPSSRTIATAIGGISHTTVNYAIRGGEFPSWAVTEKVVTYLDGDVARFRKLWVATRTGRV